MNNDFLTFLKENSNVLYIYNRGSIIYKLNSEKSDIDFLVIVNDNFKIPKQYKRYKYSHHFKRNIKFNIKYDKCDFVFFTISEWFKMIDDNHIYTWECACLNRKFIHKEYVKLLLNTDLIKLRNNYDEKYLYMMNKAQRALNNSHLNTTIKILWYLIKDAILTLQIMENHKILNFTSANIYYNQLKQCNDENVFVTFNTILTPFYSKIKEYTDGILKLILEKKYENQ